MNSKIGYSDLAKVGIEDIPFKKRIEAFYEGTRAAESLAKEVMIPQLKALIKPSRKEEAIKGLYFRMYVWMRTLVSLNDTVHFQAAASAARSIFELLLDVKLLIDDKPKNAIDKFEAFTQVERFRAAKKYVDFKNDNPGLKYTKELAREKLVSNPGKES